MVSQGFGGSFQGFLDEFQRQHNGEGTALQLVQKVTETFPSFRDQVYFEDRKGTVLSPLSGKKKKPNACVFQCVSGSVRKSSSQKPGQRSTLPT